MGDLLRRRGLKFMAVSAVVAIPAIVLLIALGWSHFNGSDSQANPDYGPLSLKFGDFGTGGYGTGGYCQGVPPPVGLLARLSSGVVSQSLLTAGYQALPAVEGAEPDLFVIRPASGGVVSEDQADSALARLGSLTVVKSAGFVLAQSQEPSLRSCDYRLSDKPAAVEIAQRATAWMVANGVLTQSQFDAEGTTFQLAEDPTKPEHLFFTVLLATPGGGIPGSENAASLTSYVATIDKSSGAILSAGRAHW